MSRPPLKIDAELEASLRRIGGALEQNRSRYAGMVEDILSSTGAAVRDEVIPRIEQKLEQKAARIVERHQRREEWHRRREERRRERHAALEEAEIPKGIVFAVVAIVCLVFAALRPQFFWMIFVALGFGMGAAEAFGKAARRRRLEREGQARPQAEPVQDSETRPAAEAAAKAPEAVPPPVEPPDPKVARIQALCDKLLAELESGPPIVREVVTEPQSTIAGLRQACLETARRERELRAVLAGQNETTLVAERNALAARLSNESDAIVRDRLGQALAALDQQLVHRAALATTATRLEAENTRILYTLENVHMQLLRARSTDMGAPELGGKLRESLRELGTQIEAVAEALELVDAPAGEEGRAPAAEVPEMTTPPVPGSGRAEAEQAERAAAARRAAQARDAQRR